VDSIPVGPTQMTRQQLHIKYVRTTQVVEICMKSHIEATSPSMSYRHIIYMEKEDVQH
jgi:hypothetical protein